MSDNILSIRGLRKQYATGVEALKAVDLDIKRGEIFALLGPNGAGKTTMISIICGIVNATAGEVLIDGKNWQKHYREARKRIGLVPQELTLDVFEPLISTVSFSRELFGRAPNPARIEEILRELSLWDKRKTILKELSGGMKRRVMIAKALAHDPDILFLDEPTAGVDVELRRDMWNMVRELRERGTTIILTTHYIEEAEEMADRIGVINRARLVVVEEKDALMRKLGKRQLTLHLQQPLHALPQGLEGRSLALSPDGLQLVYTFDSQTEQTGIAQLLRRLTEDGIDFKGLESSESSLEDIFVDLVRTRA